MSDNFSIKLGLNARDFNSGLKEANDELKHLEQMLDITSKESNKFDDDLDKLGNTLKAQEKLFDQQEKSLKMFTDGLKENRKAAKDLEKQNKDLKDELEANKKKYSALTDEQKKNSKEGKDLARAIKNIESAIKKNDTAINRYNTQGNKLRRNIEQLGQKHNNLQSELQQTQNKFNKMNTDKATKELDQYEDKIDKINKKDIKDKNPDEGITPTLDVGESAKDVAGASIDAIKTTTNAYQEQKKVIADLQTTYGGTKEEAEKLNDIARQSAKEGMSYEGMIEGIKSVKQNMKDISDGEIKSIAEGVTALTEKGYDANEVTRTASQLMNTYGIDGKTALDMITKGYQEGLDKNDNMLDTFNEYAPIFEKMGFSAEQTYSIIKAGAQNGIYDVDKLADGMKEAQLRIVEGNKGTKETFKELQLDFDKYQKAVAKGGSEGAKAMEDVAKKIMEIKDPIEQQKAGIAIFGTMWEDTGGKVGEIVSNVKGNVDNLNGSNQKMVENLKDGASGWDKFKASIDDALVGVGEKLQPVIDKIGEIAGAIAEFVANNPELQTLIAIILGLVAVFSILTVVVLTAKGAFAGLQLVMSLLSLKVLLIVGIIALVIGAIYLLWTNWDNICKWCSEAWGNLCQWISEKWQGFKTWIGESLSNIAQWFSEKFEQAKTWALEKLQALLDWVKSLPSKIWQGIQSIGKFFGDCFNNAKTWAIEKLQSLLNWVRSLPGRIWSAITEIASKFGTAFINAKNKAIDKLNSLMTWIRSIPGKVWSAISSIPQKFYNAFIQAKNRALQAISGLKDKIVNTVTGWIDKINPFKMFNIDELEQLQDVERSINYTLAPIQGLNNMITPMTSTLTPLLSSVDDSFGLVNFANDITSPITDLSLDFSSGKYTSSNYGNNNDDVKGLLKQLVTLQSQQQNRDINITIEKATIRDERDIELLAKELEKLTKDNDRRYGRNRVIR